MPWSRFASCVALLVLVTASVACANGKGPTRAELSHPLVGKPGPSFSRDRVIGGPAFDLAGERGRIVVVVFWATWCEPCKKAFPQLEKLAEKYAGRATIVGVSLDDDASGIEEFLATYDGKFEIVWDDGKKLAGTWQPKEMPASFVLDSYGIVRFVHLGYHDGEDTEIEHEVKSLL